MNNVEISNANFNNLINIIVNTIIIKKCIQIKQWHFNDHYQRQIVRLNQSILSLLEPIRIRTNGFGFKLTKQRKINAIKKDGGRLRTQHEKTELHYHGFKRTFSRFLIRLFDGSKTYSERSDKTNNTEFLMLCRGTAS